MENLSTTFDPITERFMAGVDAAVEIALAGPRPTTLSPDINRLLDQARQEMDNSIDAPPKAPCEPQAVYFIQAGESGPVKIGIARDAAQRMSELQCGSPFKLRLLGTLDGGRKHELELHRRFSAHRLEGEWFEAVPELLALVNPS